MSEDRWLAAVIERTKRAAEQGPRPMRFGRVRHANTRAQKGDEE